MILYTIHLHKSLMKFYDLHQLQLFQTMSRQRAVLMQLLQLGNCLASGLVHLTVRRKFYF